MTEVKIGDEVVNKSGSYQTIKKGEKCIVTEVIDSTRFKGPKTMKMGHYSVHDFELVKSKPIHSEPTEFRIDDRVQLVDDYMIVESESGNENFYVEKEGCVLGEVYTVRVVDHTHIQVQNSEHSYWINRKQFKLADSMPTTATQEVVETTTMKTTFRTTHYINNTPIEDFEVEQQGELIEKLEAEIARLEGFGTKTKAIHRQIVEKKADLVKIVEQFDSLED